MYHAVATKLPLAEKDIDPFVWEVNQRFPDTRVEPFGMEPLNALSNVLSLAPEGPIIAATLYFSIGDESSGFVQ